jgi:hypothetical protein
MKTIFLVGQRMRPDAQFRTFNRIGVRFRDQDRAVSLKSAVRGSQSLLSRLMPFDNAIIP